MSSKKTKATQKNPRVVEAERQKELREQEKKRNKEEHKKGLQQAKEAIENFQDPDLLLNIKEELDKDHVGDYKQKMFLFGDACSTQLIPEYRFSSAITGNSSEGKDNLWKTIHRHLPEGWFLDLTRATTASIEDDIKKYDGLYIGEGNFEGGANAPIRDTIKQLVEDGIKTLKKDKRTDCKESRYEVQPRKVGIYSTTGHSDDEELASRYCIVSVHGAPAKYKLVNDKTKQVAGDIDLQIGARLRKQHPTWIAIGLSELKKFHFIHIPWATLLEVESRDARSQRDFKRFLSLVRSLAWICQRNRMQFEYKGFEILVASAEDFYNAMEIGKEIFDQSLTGFEPRLQRVVDSYKKIIQEKPTEIKRNLEGAEEGLNWIERSLIQKELGIKKRETIHRHIKALCNMGIFTYYKAVNRTYVAFKFIDSPSDLPSNYPLITVRKKELYDIIKDNEKQILKETMDGKRTVKWTVASPDIKNKTNCLSLENYRPSDSSKSIEKDKEKSIINTLKQKMDGKNRTVDGNPSQYKKIQEIKKKIEENRKAGYTIDSEFLYKNFDNGIIDGLMRSNQLIKQGDGQYVFR